MATKKEPKPGIPIELVEDASTILSVLQELYSTHGIYLPSRAYFRSHDDAGEDQILIVDFDVNRGDGEYILVTE